MNNSEMFGCDPEKFVEQLKRSSRYEHNGATTCVVSMLSDVQEMISMGDNEKARQYLNLAKHVLFEIDDGNLVGTTPKRK